MSTLQKVIKYVAIAFAIFLVINIISVALAGVSTIAGVLNLKKSKNTIGNLEKITSDMELEDITTLNVDINYSNLKIIKGSYLQVDCNDSNISCGKNNNELSVIESNNKWFLKNKESDLVIYISEDLTLEKVKINTGAGEIYIEDLTCEEFEFKMGAGKTTIDKITILSEGKIEGGAGKTEIRNAQIHNLDADLGVGEFKFNGKLTGNSNIEAGICSTKINLTDDIENYTFKLSKGIGSICINGKMVKNDETYGSGDNYIKIEGGIGSIDIK